MQSKLTEIIKQSLAGMLPVNQINDIAPKVAEGICKSGVLPQWINIEDRLPAEDSEVIACIYNATEATALNYNKRGFFDDLSNPYRVTHWMLFPDVPKAKIIDDGQIRVDGSKVVANAVKDRTPDGRPRCITGKNPYGLCSCCRTEGILCCMQCADKDNCNVVCGYITK